MSIDITIRLYDILWRVKNAGPSPDNNKRTELYFGGCNKALSGHPCKDCFNPTLWDYSTCYPKWPEEIADVLDNSKIPKYVTIVGGEPTDQLGGLFELGRILHERGYHLMLFSWRSIEWFKDNLLDEELKWFNIIVTDPYDCTQRIYNTNRDDGVHNVIGSANQRIWLTAIDKWFKAGDVRLMTVGKNNKTEVVLLNGERQKHFVG